MEAGTLSALRSSRMLAVGTGARIVLSPVVMALVLNHSYTIATIVFLVAAATDWVDGRLARRWGVTTRLGSFLDTTADKLLVTTALIALVSVQRVSPWIALVIVAREFVILGLRLAVESGGRHMETSMLGKWKATVQFVAIALAMIRPDVVIAGAYLDQWAMVIAAVVTVWSGIDYLARSSDALRSAPS
ncbi:MAG: CDP-diacylglycerol--glycerol-3-phosphate 3-phosphatidyltransferase [Solirubrobacteraceae bacterium]